MFEEKILHKTKPTLRRAKPEDKHDLASLIHFETYVHRHLDYRPPLDSIGKQPFIILEQHGDVVAALACPPDPPNIAWIRLFVCAHHVSPEKAWNSLWPVVFEQLKDLSDLSWVATVPIYSWFEKLVKQSEFELDDHIMLFRWENNELPVNQVRAGDFTIRPMTLDDMHEVGEVDQASFVPIWQNTKDYLEIAYRQSSIATIAEVDGRVVGYQISTSTPMGGHLARLAVSPEFQNRGIGYQLLYDLLSQFYRRGAGSVTVNTQHDNQASIALYEKIGFRSTGESYPIYHIPLG